MNRSTCSLLALLAGLAPLSAIAQDDFDLGTLVLSGSLTPQLESRTAATVEVLEEEDLADETRPLSDSLARLPGVNVTTNGPLGTQSSVFIRGLPSRYIGVRIDGIDVADPTGTQVQFNFGGLTGAGFSRAEVLKGSQSALHGSEAVGGLISLSSARPTEEGLSGSVSAEYGSFNTFASSANVGYLDDTVELSFTLSSIDSDGYSALANNTEEDGISQRQVNASFRYTPSADTTLGAAIYYRDSEFDYDSTFGTPETGDGQSEQFGYRLFAEFSTDLIAHSISYSGFNSKRQLNTFEAEGDREQLSYLGSMELAATQLSFGLDRTTESYDGLTGDVTTNAVFGEAVFLGDDVDVSLALRYDDNSQFGSATTGRLGVVWRATENTTLRGLLANGYRTPSINELFGPFGANPDLQPEQSRTAEIGLERSFGFGATVRGTLFYTEIDDLIDFFDPDGFGGPIPGGYTQVPGTTVTKGLELEGDVKISETFSLYGNYTYTDARNEDVRQIRVPRHAALLGADLAFADRYTANLELQHNADTVSRSGGVLEDFTVVNLGVTAALTDTAEAYLRVENLFDTDYETIEGYNTSDRALYVGLRASF